MIGDRARKYESSMCAAIEIERHVGGVYLKIAVRSFPLSEIDDPAALQIDLECSSVAEGRCFTLVAEFFGRKSTVVDSETGHFESRGLFSRKLKRSAAFDSRKNEVFHFPRKGSMGSSVFHDEPIGCVGMAQKRTFSGKSFEIGCAESGIPRTFCGNERRASLDHQKSDLAILALPCPIAVAVLRKAQRAAFHPYAREIVHAGAGGHVPNRHQIEPSRSAFHKFSIFPGCRRVDAVSENRAMQMASHPFWNVENQCRGIAEPFENYRSKVRYDIYGLLVCKMQVVCRSRLHDNDIAFSGNKRQHIASSFVPFRRPIDQFVRAHGKRLRHQHCSQDGNNKFHHNTSYPLTFRQLILSFTTAYYSKLPNI